MRSLIIAALLLAQPAFAISPTKAEIGQVQWKAYVCRVFYLKSCRVP
jgi:hypothetical protein